MPLLYEPRRASLFAFGDSANAITRLFAGGSSGKAAVVVPPGTRTNASGTLFPIAHALGPLATLAAGAEVPASVAAWSLASKLALDLVARERIVPWAEEGRARWAVALAAEDQAVVHQLASALPPAAHALCIDPAAAKSAARGADVWEPEALLRAFLDDAADAFVRSAIDPERLPLATKDGPWERRWVKALASADPSFFATGFSDRNVLRDLAAFSRPARSARDEPRTCLRLELPTDEDPSFRVRLLLQAPDDPSLLVSAEDVWAGRGKKLGRAFRDPEESLLAGLGAAARLYRPLRACLDERAPSALRLDVEDAWSFLADAAPALSDAGFGVLVPAELTAGGARRLALRARIGDEERPRRSTKIAGRVDGTAGLGLAELVDFHWQAAIGDQVLTKSELAALAKQKAPLVRFRGAWVAVDPSELAEIRKRVAEGPRKVRAMSALTMLLAGETGGEEARVAPVVAEGAAKVLLERVRDAASAPLTPPAALHATLRPYQERGLAWLATMAALGLGGCLADDMGLGKTIQVLAFLLHYRERVPGDRRPTLLVAPTSVVGNWEREIARFAPSLSVVRHYGGGRARAAQTLTAGDIVLTTYGLVRRDIGWLSDLDWAAVVLDEAQNAKNAASATAKAVRQLRATHRFALTGTPVENRLAELWSVLDFANPGMLGPLGRFRDTFAVPIERFANQEVASRLRRMVAPFLLRRLKSDPAVIQDLPAKNEMDVLCTLTREQATLYQAVVDEQLRQVKEREGVARQGAVLAMLMALKQICNHPAQYLSEKGPLARRSGKLARLTEMLEEAMSAGDKALVFTQYREMGDRLVAHLSESLGVEVAFLHGGTSKRARDELVQRFQEDPNRVRVFILSLKAGGTGLNLTAANHVFHYDRWWNPAVEDQATDRAYRIGQKRAVQVHKLACAGTVEDRVAQMLDKKRKLADSVLGGGERWITQLDDDELRALVTLSKDVVVSDVEEAS